MSIKSKPYINSSYLKQDLTATQSYQTDLLCANYLEAKMRTTEKLIVRDHVYQSIGFRSHINMANISQEIYFH
jgi:hypothetical protein